MPVADLSTASQHAGTRLDTHVASGDTSTTMVLYTVLLPTYCERENLPLIIWLLAKTFDEK